ncbi:MAG: hypothetical protein KDA80_20175, partial [Planctomycetaceae bacterium]|nr:hypothetical protein [Planctomycetaceae bacterium]
MRSQKHELILKSTDFWSVFGLIVWLLLSSAVPAQEEVFTSADEAFYLTISQAYDQQELGNLDEATRLMEQGLLDEDLSEEARSSGMRVLSWFYTEAGRHPEAISIYGDLIYGNEDHLDRAELLSLRADSWEAIGQSDLAQIDRRMADQYFRIAFEEQESPTSLLDLKHHWEHISTLLPEPLRSLENKWALAAIIYLLLGGLLFSANILAGWRQSVEGNGTWARLLGVAAY